VFAKKLLNLRVGIGFLERSTVPAGGKEKGRGTGKWKGKRRKGTMIMHLFIPDMFYNKYLSVAISRC
jgi:hypothetical protein